MRLTSNTAVRGTLALLATATILVGVSACSGDSEEPAETTTSQAPEETSSEAPEETTEESTDASGQLCTSEQLATLASSSGAPLDPTAVAGSTATFEPADSIAGLPVVCIASFSSAGVTASFAVVSDQAGSLATLEANLTAAGAAPLNAGGTVVATVGEIQVTALPFTQLTQQTAGFENPDDLLVILSTPALG